MIYGVGVDFGTTNSVIAFADEKGAVHSLSWPSANGPTQTFRTALTFWKQGRGLGHVAGPQALERAIAAEPTERFIQSFKTHLASRVFSEARLFGQKVTIEDMVAIFLRHLFEAQGGTKVAEGAFLSGGRPVVFAGERPDEALAASFTLILRAIFERRFGAQKLHYDNPFQSVAAGLALLAADRRRRAGNRNAKRIA